MSNVESIDHSIDLATQQRYVASLRQWRSERPGFAFAGKTVNQWIEEIERGSPEGLSMLRTFMEFDARHGLQPESQSPPLTQGEARRIIHERMAQAQPLLRGILEGRYDHVLNADPPLSFEELRAFFRQQMKDGQPEGGPAPADDSRGST